MNFFKKIGQHNNMIIDLGYWNKVIKKLVSFILTIIGIYFVMKMFIFFMPFLIAIIISALIEPIIKFIIKKTNLTRKTSAIIALVFTFLIIAGLILGTIFTVITESSDLLENLNYYMKKISLKINDITNNFNLINFEIPEQLQKLIEGSSKDILNTGTGYIKQILLSTIEIVKKIPSFFIYFAITILATYFICTDKIFILDELEYHIPKRWLRKWKKYLSEIGKSLGYYLKAQVILITISFIITLVGLYILKFLNYDVQYPFLAALGIGFVDALPILGTGTVMIPWIIITFLNEKYSFAIALLILYITIVVVREFLEPRIISGQIGMHPLYTLIAMYTGFKISGVIGLIGGPIVLIIYSKIFGKLIDKGIIKTIFNKTR